MIYLTGGGHISQWHFPENTSICPVLGCHLQFQTRFQAIEHYRQRHAMYAILCKICSKPIRIDTKKDAFVSHYRRMHPDQAVPTEFDDSPSPPKIKKLVTNV